MKRAGVILAIEFLLLAFYAGSALAFFRYSQDFILASRSQTLPPLEMGETVALASSGPDDGMLLGGWTRETAGIRAGNARPELALRLPRDAAAITFSGEFAFSPQGGQHIDVLLDGHALATIEASGPPGTHACRWSLVLPPADRDISVLTFAIVTPARFVLETLALADQPEETTCAGGAKLSIGALS
ncbi:MAG TPA: hypothetical protein VHA07_01230 [Devosia sp.]|nr:hypothetical protein [Devosia sp.]